MRHKRSPLEFTLITWASLAFSTNQCVEPLFGLASCGIIHAGRGFVYLVQSGTNATHNTLPKAIYRAHQGWCYNYYVIL